MATKGNLGEVVTTCERGLGFKPRRGGFPSGARKKWGLSPKAKVRVLHTAQLDVTDFNTKFYNSLGRALNRCSSNINKTRDVVIVHSENRLERLDQ
nr:hypothetical protein [Tanacetum cinerariifolium]